MINNPLTARAAMQSLAQNGNYAVLHREEDLSEGQLHSDIDVVVGEDPYAILRRMIIDASAPKLVSFYEYEVGAVSSFWVAPGDLSVAQIDMLWDPTGRGCYGLLSGRVLDAAVPGERWMRAPAAASHAYLVSKRAHKAQPANGGLDGHSTPSDFPRFLSPRRLDELGLSSGSPTDRSVMSSIRRIGRVRRRLVHPVGFHARIAGGDAQAFVDATVSRFEGYLPVVTDAPRGRRSTIPLLKLRFQPSLMVTAARLPAPPHVVILPAAEPFRDWQRLFNIMSLRAGHILRKLVNDRL